MCHPQGSAISRPISRNHRVVREPLWTEMSNSRCRERRELMCKGGALSGAVLMRRWIKRKPGCVRGKPIKARQSRCCVQPWAGKPQTPLPEMIWKKETVAAISSEARYSGSRIFPCLVGIVRVIQHDSILLLPLVSGVEPPGAMGQALSNSFLPSEWQPICPSTSAETERLPLGLCH